MSKLFLPTQVLSFALAAASVCIMGFVGLPLRPLWLIALGWLVLFAFALVAFRRRGLWVLASAPFAFVPGALLFAYIATCSPARGCL